MASSSESGAHETGVFREDLSTPAPLRHKWSDTESEALLQMFADAHALATESYERHLADEIGKVRLDVANLRAELLKWCFVFWIGQLAVQFAGLATLLTFFLDR